MALAAAQVVDALAARLTPVVATGGRVYTSRWWPITEGELPAWQVLAEDEAVEPADLDGVNVHRLTVQCAGYTRAVNDLDDRLHDLAEAGLTALCALPRIHGAQITAIDRTVEQTGEAAVGVIRLRLETTFYVAQTAPGTILS